MAAPVADAAAHAVAEGDDAAHVAADAANDAADAPHPTIPTAVLLRMRKADLISALDDRGLDAMGNVHDLRARLIDATRPLAAAPDDHQGKKEDPDLDHDGKHEDAADEEGDADCEWSLAAIGSMPVAQIKTELKRRNASTTGPLPALRKRLIRLTQDDRLRHRVSKIKPNGKYARTPVLLVPSSIANAAKDWWSAENPFFKNAHQLRTAWDTSDPVEVSLSGGTLRSTKTTRPGFPNFATIVRVDLELRARGHTPESWHQLVRSARYLTDAPYQLTDEALQHWSCLMALHCRASHEAGNDEPELPQFPASAAIMEQVKSAFPHTSYSRMTCSTTSTSRKPGSTPSARPAPRKKARASATGQPSCLFCPTARTPHATDDCKSAVAQRARKAATTAGVTQTK